MSALLERKCALGTQGSLSSIEFFRFIQLSFLRTRRLLAPWVAILSWCHTSQLPQACVNPQTSAGDIPGIDDVVGDVNDFVIDVIRLNVACPQVLVAKFLVAGDPAKNCRSPGHAGIGADGAEALAVGKSLADRGCDFGGVIGWSATLGLVFGLHRSIKPLFAWSRNLGPPCLIYWSVVVSWPLFKARLSNDKSAFEGVIGELAKAAQLTVKLCSGKFIHVDLVRFTGRKGGDGTKKRLSQSAGIAVVTV